MLPSKPARPRAWLGSVIVAALMGAAAVTGCGGATESASKAPEKVKIEFTSPKDDSGIKDGTAHVAGTYSPENVTLDTVSDVIEQYENGTFTFDQPIHPGKNEIVVTAAYDDDPETVVYERTLVINYEYSAKERKAREKRRKARADKRRRALTKSYSGNGLKNLGSVRVAADSTLRWTNDGAIFQIFTDQDVLANSQASRGNTFLGQDTYTNFKVNAVGNWTIKITPR